MFFSVLAGRADRDDKSGSSSEKIRRLCCEEAAEKSFETWKWKQGISLNTAKEVNVEGKETEQPNNARGRTLPPVIWRLDGQGSVESLFV